MFAVHAYKSYEGEINPLVLMTQVLSVLTFKKNNPSIPFKLYVDTPTLHMMNEFEIPLIYDEVNVGVLDKYPSDRISDKFWASPKLWVMKHINEPFIMMDNDLIWHDKVEDYLDFDLTYLHLEPSASYPYPHKISKPNGFKWEWDLIESFGQSLPMNCALTIWNNIDLKKEYVYTYFDFVLDNPAMMNTVNEDWWFIHKHGMQITIEQWMLGAYCYYWNKFVEPIKTHSLLNMLAFPDWIQAYDPNQDPSVAFESMNKHVFHLWGAKAYYEDGEIDKHIKVVNELYNATQSITGAESREWFIFESITDKLPQLD